VDDPTDAAADLDEAWEIAERGHAPLSGRLPAHPRPAARTEQPLPLGLGATRPRRCPSPDRPPIPKNTF